MLLDGIHVPLTTPFYPDGRLNLRKLEHNVERFSLTPASGLVLLGPTGEATTLSDAETREALTIAIAVAAPEKVMLAAIPRDGLAILLDLLDHAAAASYDAALIAPPTSLTPHQTREALTFLQAAADRSPIPLILHSTLTHPLPLDTITELASHPNIIAVIQNIARPDIIPILRERTAHIKHTAMVTTVFAAVTARMQAQALKPVAGSPTFVGVDSLQTGGTALAIATPSAPPALKTRTRETGFQMLNSGTTSLLNALREGATGLIPALAACVPQACFEVYAAFKDGDQALAEEKQNRLIPAAARMEQLGIPALKYAADLNGYFGGRTRLPLLPLSAQERSEVEVLLQPMRN